MEKQLKKYNKPTIEVVDVSFNQCLCAGSAIGDLRGGAGNDFGRGFVYVKESTTGSDGGFGSYKSF